MAPANSCPAATMRAGNPTIQKIQPSMVKVPKSLLMKAGDLYLLSSQTWHRGAPNTSDRIRYLFHQVYGQRFVAQRFWPYLNYHMPDYVLEGADERLLRVLGKHPEMAYG